MFSGCPIGKEALSHLPIHQRAGPRLGGIGLSGAYPFVGSVGARILAEAIQYRVFAKIARVIEAGVFEHCANFTDLLLPDFLLEGEPMETWEWICSMPTRRRKALIRALHKREDRGAPCKNYRFIKPFVKSEHLPFFGQCEGDYTPGQVEYLARLIQAPHDETHLDAGRFLKPVVVRLKEVWHYRNWIFYASVTPEKLDEWLRRNQDATSWFWADYSSFDCTYSEEAWAMIERFYAKIYPHAPPEFWQAIDAWRRPVGKVVERRDGVKITYEPSIINASGRDDTALANALINGIVLACSIAAAYSGVQVMDLTLEQLQKVSYLVNIAIVGDDSLVACSFDVTPLEKTIVENISRFGLITKANSSCDLCDVTFLGMMPYPAKGTYTWGPTLGRRLYKAFWQLDPVGNLPAWTHGVAQQLRLFRHVPVLWEMADQICRLLDGFKVTSVKADENRVWSNRTESTPDWDQSTLDFICRRYSLSGLTPSAIRADISTIRGITRLPAVVRLHTTDAALAVDDL